MRGIFLIFFFDFAFLVVSLLLVQYPQFLICRAFKVTSMCMYEQVEHQNVNYDCIVI